MTEPALSLAKFTAKTDARGRDIPENDRKPIPVHFNPDTLDITYTNTVQGANRDQPAQVASETTAKLSMELIYDTSMKGSDVRMDTHKIIQMMDPAERTPRRRSNDEAAVPAIVIFRWGTILFEGYIDSYKERLEFFSPEGVPLRAVVTISMKKQQRSFSPVQSSARSPANRSNADLTPGQNDPVKRLARNENLTHTAGNLGDVNAAKQLAQQNGVENLRHPEVDQIVVSRQPAQAASGLSASARTDPGVNLALAAGGTEAQFSDLRAQVSAGANLTPRAQLNLDVGGGAGQALSLKGRSGFGLGGEVDAEAGAGLTADVGLNADIELGIQFEE